MDVGSLANSLMGVHAMMAVGLKMPEMVISEDDAKRLAGPIIELQKHYKIPFDPKWVAWFQLCTAGGAIYLPRMVVASRRLSTQKKHPIRPAPAHPFDGLQAEAEPIAANEPGATVPPEGFKLDLSGAN